MARILTDESGPLRPLFSFQRWLARLVQRPADLLEVFSGCGTLGLVIIALVNHLNGKGTASLDLLSAAVTQPYALLIAGVFALLQPIALHLDDPHNPRHPFEQPTKWLRTVAASAVLLWYLTLVWAVGLSIGLAQVQAMYGMAAGMNLYIVAHVLFRKRG